MKLSFAIETLLFSAVLFSALPAFASSTPLLEEAEGLMEDHVDEVNRRDLSTLPELPYSYLCFLCDGPIFGYRHLWNIDNVNDDNECHSYHELTDPSGEIIDWCHNDFYFSYQVFLITDYCMPTAGEYTLRIVQVNCDEHYFDTHTLRLYGETIDELTLFGNVDETITFTVEPFPDPPTPSPVFFATPKPTQCGEFGDGCNRDSDCCSDKCRGPKKSKTCKA